MPKLYESYNKKSRRLPENRCYNISNSSPIDQYVYLDIWSGKRTRLNSSIKQLIYTFPSLLPAILAGSGAVGMILLILGIFITPLVLILGGGFGLLLSAVIYKKIKLPNEHQKEHLWVSVLATIFVSSWLIFNIFYTAQHLLIDRDPGLYVNAAHYLVTHDNLTLASQENLKAIEGAYETSQGVDYSSESVDEIHIQGSHMLPLVLGLLGRFVGEVHMLRLVVLFGAVGLLAFYAFTRCLMKPRWAFLGTVILGISLPMIYFSRDAYTEPLTLGFIFGGLMLLWHAQQLKSRALWSIAGILLGASVLTRPDALLPVTGVIGGLWMWALLRPPAQRRPRVIDVALFVTVLTVCLMTAWLDLTMLSNHYYAFIHGQILSQIYLFILVLLGGAVVFYIFSRYAVIYERLMHVITKYGSRITTFAILIVAAILVSRPLWWQSRGGESFIVAEIQSKLGMPIDATRKYIEYTASWPAWYIGVGLSVIGLAGYVLLVRKSTKQDGFNLLPFLFAFTVTSALYMVRPSIVPDHIWAVRRFLPVILPGLIIMAMYSLSEVNKRYKVHPLINIVLVLLLIWGPLQVSQPFLKNRSVAQHDYIKDLCNQMENNEIIVWMGISAMSAVRTTSNYCGIQSLGVRGGYVTKEDLNLVAKQVKNQGKKPILAIYSSDLKWFPWLDSSELVQASRMTWEEPERTVDRAPRKLEKKEESIFLGAL